MNEYGKLWREAVETERRRILTELAASGKGPVIMRDTIVRIVKGRG